MRTYYLFSIQEKFIDDDAYALYQLLEDLYRLKKDDYRFGISFFKQICNLFETNNLHNYMKEKFNLKNKQSKYILWSESFQERSIIKLNPSCIKIESNINVPHILRPFSLYSSNIFVCDFQNQDYFWLSSLLESTSI